MLALADLGLRSQDEKTYVNWLEKAAAAHPQALQPDGLARHLLAKAIATRRLRLRAKPSAPSRQPCRTRSASTTQLALGDTTNALQLPQADRLLWPGRP